MPATKSIKVFFFIGKWSIFQKMILDTWGVAVTLSFALHVSKTPAPLVGWWLIGKLVTVSGRVASLQRAPPLHLLSVCMFVCVICRPGRPIYWFPAGDELYKGTHTHTQFPISWCMFDTWWGCLSGDKDLLCVCVSSGVTDVILQSH